MRGKETNQRGRRSPQPLGQQGRNGRGRSRLPGQPSLWILLLQGGLGSLGIGHLVAAPATLATPAPSFRLAQGANPSSSPSPPVPILNDDAEESAPSVIWLIVMPAIPILAGGAICLSRRLKHSCADASDGMRDDAASAAAIAPSSGAPPDPDHPTVSADAPESAPLDP